MQCLDLRFEKSLERFKILIKISRFKIRIEISFCFHIVAEIESESVPFKVPLVIIKQLYYTAQYPHTTDDLCG